MFSNLHLAAVRRWKIHLGYIHWRTWEGCLVAADPIFMAKNLMMMISVSLRGGDNPPLSYSGHFPPIFGAFKHFYGQNTCVSNKTQTNVTCIVDSRIFRNKFIQALLVVDLTSDLPSTRTCQVASSSKRPTRIVMAPGFESDILRLYFNVSILSQSKTQQAWHVDTCPPMKRETTTNWSRKWADLNRTQTFHTIVHQPHWAWTCHKHKHHHKRQHHPLFVGSISQHPSATLQGDTFGTQALDEIPESSSTELAFLKNIFMETGGEEKKLVCLEFHEFCGKKKNARKINHGRDAMVEPAVGNAEI